MSIISDFFATIGKLIKKLNLGKLFKDWFSDDNMDDILKNFASYGVTILERLKLGLDNPAVTTVTDALPGDWDLKIVDAAEKVVNELLEKTIEGKECASLPTFKERFDCFYKMASGKDDISKAQELSGFAAQISYGLIKELKTTGGIDINKLLSLVPAIFVKLFGKKD